MASFSKFNSFVAAIANKVHNLGSDTLRIALTNSAPSASNTQLSNITEITYTNIASNPTSRNVTGVTSTQTSGTYSLVGSDVVMTATGSVGPFRYAVLYNTTATNGELIGFWDYGSSITLASGETFTVDFGSTILTIGP